jgi:hypothetical protein
MLFWIYDKVWNFVIAGVQARFVVSYLHSMIYGRDMPGTKDVAVGTAPGPLRTSIPLPEPIASEMRREADKAAQRRIGELRVLLGETALLKETTVFWERFRALGRGDELIHTSYFSRKEIVEILATHMQEAEKSVPELRSVMADLNGSPIRELVGPPALFDRDWSGGHPWLVEFCKCRDLQLERIGRDAAYPLLSSRNWRA